MSATRSWLLRRRLDLVVGATVLVNLTLMVLLPRLATVPFHLIWIALAVLFGFREWGSVGADAVAVGVCGLTAGVFAWDAVHDGIETEEITEAPLMALAFLVMVTFQRRKQARLEVTLAALQDQYEGRRHDQAVARRASHDLRSPLTVARGYAELIRMHATDPVVREDSEAVIDAVDRVVTISLQLRDLPTTPASDTVA